MFKKILIANRGEIACRVIRTARKMGIKTVAVYSEADADAVHVRDADEAVLIGPAPSSESYLVIDNILKAIKDTGADAVHPGYGFLSENAAFVAALEAAGITFIGPGTRAIAAMGDKIESKILAGEAKVSTVPGHTEVIADAAEAIKVAHDIGFPVMIKASAGGGGKGMRIAWHEDEVEEGFSSATNEAKASFGDDRIFIEKYITSPRHIEIQILADSHGNTIYLGERECSIQRRHQKVIEEAPSPFLDAKTRKAMGEQAVKLAKAVDYVSAGTVEFIVDKDRNFYFLEMNTRLQVEHPVTEMVTGIDLVEQMIRIAAGETLAIKQSDVKLNGWAFEARVYAENPRRGFLPSIGRLTRYAPPKEGKLRSGGSVRNDTGVTEGSEISIHYDPMIAKLCTHNDSRVSAIADMRHALDAFVIRGISHNIPFLGAVIAHPRFVRGDLSTEFIAEEFGDGFNGGSLGDAELHALVAVAALVHGRDMERARAIGSTSPHDVPPIDSDWVVTFDGDPHPVVLERTADGFSVSVEGDAVAVSSDWQPGDRLVEATVNGVSLVVQIEPNFEGYHLTHGGAEVKMAVRSVGAAELAALMPEKAPPDTSQYLLCPMPGVVVSLLVAAGDEADLGTPLCVVEAMKMENILRAERRGIIGKIHVAVGDNLAVDETILEFEEDPAEKAD